VRRPTDDERETERLEIEAAEQARRDATLDDFIEQNDLFNA
jgi:hypothetical protein